MLHQKIIPPAPTTDLPDQLPNTPVSPVRHGRLFELLRNDTNCDLADSEDPALKPRKEYKLTDDEMLSIQAKAMKTLVQRDF